MRDFHMPGRSAVFAQNAICATSHPLAALTAIDTLKSGGNALDAAIAGALLLGLCEPQMTGLGGDLFALVKPAGSDEVLGWNGSGRAPAGVSAADLRARGAGRVDPDSADSVTVPGAVDAVVRMSARWGRLGLDRVLAPVIDAYETGVPVAPRVAFDWARWAGRLQGGARDVYLPWGAAPAPGSRFALPAQADVLRRIAAQGRDGFYAGPVAEDMVNSLRALGGAHTLDDFAALTTDQTTPIAAAYRGYELVEHPPNGQGATALLMAGILSRFDLAALDPFGATRAHIEAEATKLAYDARDRFVSDPATMTGLDHMLADDTAAALAALIDPARALPDPHAASAPVHAPETARHKETVYITVVDRDRMAVSLIYSIFHDFGSGLASDRFGILFQNRGAGFSLVPGHANELAGGKRPMHTIIPAMLRHKGRVVMPFGVMGGAYQPTGHLRVLGNMLDYGMDPQAALDGARSFADAGVLKVERGYTDAVRSDLAARGHRVSVPDVPIGGAQAIWIDPDTGILQGASDPRKDGIALGY